MPRTAKEVINPKRHYSREGFDELGRVLGNMAGVLEGEEKEAMLKYSQTLLGINGQYDAKNENDLQKSIDGLTQLPEFLTKVYPTIRKSGKFADEATQKELDGALLLVNRTLRIDLDYEKITGEKRTITVSGKKYTRKEFRQALYNNHWDKRDGYTLNTIFDGIQHANLKELSPQAREEEKQLLDKLFNEPIGAYIPAQEKYDILDSFAKWDAIPTWDKNVLEKEQKRQDYIRKGQEAGWNSSRDTELLENLYDAFFKNKELTNEEMEPSLNIESFNGNNLDKRIEFLSNVQKQITKNPVKQGSVQDTAIGNIQKEIDYLNNTTVRKSYEFADKIIQNNVWTTYVTTKSDGRELLKDMYMLAEGLPEGHAYKQQMELFTQEKSNIYPEYNLKPGQNGYINAVQSAAEYKKCAELLEKLNSEDPKVKNVIGRINSYVENLEKSDFYKDQMEKLDLGLKWAHMSQEEKDALTDFDKAVHKIPYAETTEEERNLATKIGFLATYNPDYTGAGFKGNLKLDFAKVKDGFFDFMNNLDESSEIFQKGLKIVNTTSLDLLTPEQKELLIIRQENAKVDETVRALERQGQREKSLQYSEDLQKLTELKRKLDSVQKSYIGHSNSTIYDAMVRKLSEAINCESAEDYLNIKKDLTKMTTDYLDHTKLGRASKLHPNAEIRRLCAFDILAITDDDAFKDYQERANQLRKGADKITLDKISRMHGGGTEYKVKVDYEKILQEERAEHKKKTNGKKLIRRDYKLEEAEEHMKQRTSFFKK